MKTIELNTILFAKNVGIDNRFNKRFKEINKASDMESSIELLVPDILNPLVLERYILNCIKNNKPVNQFQLEALAELLTKADRCGHNINELLTVATASNWSRVVFDNHLKPLDKSS